MHILGISAFYHDSAAALVVDGKIVAAAQEERFTRKKHDAAFPVNAVDYCLGRVNKKAEEIDYVVFYDKPLLKFDRLIETYVTYAPRGYDSFVKAMQVWLKEKVSIRRQIKKNIGVTKRPIVFVEHHQSHAASAFYPSPFQEAAIVTVDGVGEWATASIGTGTGADMKLLKIMNFPHSLGLLYSAFTYYCGFKVNSGEYKLMGLAPYGRPVYADKIRDELIDVKQDGSVWMNMDYFNYCCGLTMTSSKFDNLFEGPRRSPETELTQREMDLAASVQAVTEDAMMKMCLHAKAISGKRNLCLAGGVALNCVANGEIARSGEFDNIWIQPAAGDAGGSLGAALFVWHQLLKNNRDETAGDRQFASYLGPKYDNAEIQEFLDTTEAVYDRLDSEDELLTKVAEAIADGKVIGWFHGRMEFGPRALGARSIIGDPRNTVMQSTMNRKIKFRESFRPFAPCVLIEDVSEYFELDHESPYMLLVAPVKDSQRTELSDEDQQVMEDPDLRRRVNVVRSTVPAITHVDYSARVQTVDPERHGRFYRLIKRFKELTGCPVIINTSFNIRGEPIVNTPENAYNCFLKTEMDVLVLEDQILLKEKQPEIDEETRENYRKEFPLD